MPRRKADPAIQEIVALLEQTDDEISAAATAAIMTKIKDLEPSGIMGSKLPTAIGRRHSRALKAYEVAVNEKKLDQLEVHRENADRWCQIEESMLALVEAYLAASDKAAMEPI